MNTISPGILATARLLSVVAVSFLVAGCGGSMSSSYQLPGTQDLTRNRLPSQVCS
jgi:predicted ABC-type sugar transport system permease subunit